jgi:hypothetical protein
MEFFLFKELFSKIDLGRARPRRDIARAVHRASLTSRRPALDGRAPRAFPTPLCPRPRATRSPTSQRVSLPEVPRTAPLRRRTRAVRATDPWSVRGADRTCAGRGAVAQRNPPSSPRRHPESARIKGRRIFPQSRCPAVLPHPPPATIRAAAETLASLTPGVVRVAWHLP